MALAATQTNLSQLPKQTLTASDYFLDPSRAAGPSAGRKPARNLGVVAMVVDTVRDGDRRRIVVEHLPPVADTDVGMTMMDLDSQQTNTSQKSKSAPISVPTPEQSSPLATVHNDGRFSIASAVSNASVSPIRDHMPLVLEPSELGATQPEL